MSAPESRSLLHVSPNYQPMFRELGLDAERIFDHPDIEPWRTLPDRENCILDTKLAGGQRIRWHIKRYAAVGGTSPAEIEVEGIRLLERAKIPTVELIGHGKLADERSFLILNDLAGYTAGDKWLERGQSIDPFIEPVAELAAQLHRAGLHHRDLYICHFMLRADPKDVRLIDAARVRSLPRGPLRLRWIVKDVAQLWHSLAPGSAAQSVMDSYNRRMGWTGWRAAALGWWMRSKSHSIARHDRRLRQKQPRRNISLPENRPG
ncbi:MAG TPA: lipopolysaccharide kinase InaA family protein [Tepidisphaeraceae bacterium]|nr:lipopolysaccharide kinase InaA family protein [Tepidisphaeraceae bacterium]